jgi:Protein of unknown function (DUF732)
MMEIGQRSMLRAVLIGTVVAAVAMRMASPAIADAGQYPGDDAAFFSYLASNGYPSSATPDLRNTALKLAAATCRLFEGGGTASWTINNAIEHGDDVREVRVLDVASVNFYCPWNRAALNS